MRSNNTLDLREYCQVLCVDKVSVSGQNRIRYLQATMLYIISSSDIYNVIFYAMVIRVFVFRSVRRYSYI